MRNLLRNLEIWFPLPYICSIMAKNNQIIGTGWRLDKLWNESLHTIPERPMQPRNYMYASELGGSYIDRYLKMNAVPMTNKPNDRSLRKFSAGHVFEWIVGLVLTMAGVMKAKQLRGEYQIPGCLSVAGRLDFIAGGLVDWDAAEAKVKELQSLFSVSMSDMPPIVFHAVEKILAQFRAQFQNNPLKEVVFECKSVSSFMSDKLDRTGEPMPHHVLQCQHYLLSNEMDEAYLFYISKDDMKAYQFSVVNDKKTLGIYAADAKKMTEYYNAGFDAKKPLRLAPPPEPEVTFDNGTFRFGTNYKVEYSNYLTLLYPQYPTPMAYREFWDSRVASWNRVFKRAATGQNITAKNKEIIDDAIAVFPDWEQKVASAIKAGAFIDETETQDA